jgi:hypothetical protein
MKLLAFITERALIRCILDHPHRKAQSKALPEPSELSV